MTLTAAVEYMSIGERNTETRGRICASQCERSCLSALDCVEEGLSRET